MIKEYSTISMYVLWSKIVHCLRILSSALPLLCPWTYFLTFLNLVDKTVK